MRNSILDQKMRIVDLGVATCIDAIIRNAETLLKDGTNPAEQANAKAEIRKHAHLYKQALEELLGVLDADEQGNSKPGNFADFPQNLTACSACGIADKATDEAMQQLAIATEAAISIPFIIQQLIETVGNPQKLENALYDFAEMATVYLKHTDTKRQTLQEVLIVKEQGGKNA